jgi:putative copper export protein
MSGDLVHVLPTALDLLALATCLGSLSGRLWVLPPTATAADAPHAESLLTPLWQLLVACLVGLTVSSIGELVGRAVNMSGRPLSAIVSVLPTVLFRTHYGRVWLIRPVALAGLWVRWWVGRGRLHARAIPTLMVGAWALIALTRSASSHAADWGDLTLAELMDWLHLLAGSLWGGGLLALSSVVLPAARKRPDQHRLLIPAIARRFSALAGVALAGVLLTAIYNAWLEVGTFRAVWETSYGWTLLAKLLLVCPLLVLGASNRYLSVPRLQWWAGRPVSRRSPLPILRIRPALAADRRRPGGSRLVRQWARKVGAEASLVGGVFICTALLLYGVPARHFSHIEHRHREETPSSAPLGAMVGAHQKALPNEGQEDDAGAIARREHFLLLMPQQARRGLCVAKSRALAGEAVSARVTVGSVGCHEAAEEPINEGGRHASGQHERGEERWMREHNNP